MVLLTNANFSVLDKILTKKRNEDQKNLKRRFVVQNLNIRSRIGVILKAFCLTFFGRDCQNEEKEAN